MKERNGAIWVVGVDGSDNAVRALTWAAGFAPGRASTLRVFRAWQASAAISLELSAPIDLQTIKPTAAYEFIDQLAAEMSAKGVKVDSTVEYGSAARLLLDACEDADLLVMGTRGLGGFGRLLLGSTSHQCATHARIPVVVVPEKASVDGTVTEIVVGMDGSDGAKGALAWAFAFAPQDIPIRVVGAWHHSGWLPEDEWAWELEAERANETFNVAVDEVEKAAQRQGDAVRTFVMGQPATTLLDATSRDRLLVVGERGQRGLKAALLGSVATEVLHRAEGPVVIVPVPG